MQIDCETKGEQKKPPGERAHVLNHLESPVNGLSGTLMTALRAWIRADEPARCGETNLKTFVETFVLNAPQSRDFGFSSPPFESFFVFCRYKISTHVNVRMKRNQRSDRGEGASNISSASQPTSIDR
ncbi:unnamed protein product [Scytosiphon promiscuus]